MISHDRASDEEERERKSPAYSSDDTIAHVSISTGEAEQCIDSLYIC